MKSYTPFRYPGGKTQLHPWILKLIHHNYSMKPIYIEPFCGGGGLALKLLINHQVEQIYLNDLDVNVYAVWIAMLKYPTALINFIQNIPITITEWYKQKAIYADPNLPLFQKGCATLFLNRTNYSGILTARPIGGFSQTGNYKIDCRFNRINLIKIIQKISLYQKQIQIFNLDVNTFLLNLKSPLKKVFYI
ncbi:MAG: DNA adenine methylase [Candidatus Phytoplasma pyri]|uniref:DNA adenine methylase n=1 Tax=Candidatus Phytoplasma pyri TaxID=47566 RepID=UPI0039834013